MSKHQFTTSVVITFGDGGDVDADAMVAFDYSAGTPERGRFGPPENYDSGSAGEVFITAVMLSIEGENAIPAPWLVDVIAGDDDLVMAMETSAIEELDALREYAMERRAEERREWLQETRNER